MKASAHSLCYRLVFCVGLYLLFVAHINFEKDSETRADADQLLLMLDHQIEWFSVYEKEFLLENKEAFKQSGEWKEAYNERRKNKKKIQQSKKEFLRFRDNFIQFLNSMNCPSPYNRTLIAHARNQITKEYVQLIQDCIFPVRWEVLYDAYLEEEKKALTSLIDRKK